MSVTSRKIELEALILKDLDTFFDKISDEYQASMSAAGIPVNAIDYNDELKSLLMKHYERSIYEFAEDELSFILPFLINYARQEALTVSAIITETNQKNINRAQVVGQAQAQEDREAGEVVTQSTVALIGSLHLRRLFDGRKANIATTETQTLSEPTRMTVAEVHAGQPTTIGNAKKPFAVKYQLDKTWRDQDDDIVRLTHAEADGQVRPHDQPFAVGGSLLNFPRDTSLGAPIKEIANCRCYTNYIRGKKL